MRYLFMTFQEFCNRLCIFHVAWHSHVKRLQAKIQIKGMLRRLNTTKITHQLCGTFCNKCAFLTKLLCIRDSVIRLIRCTKSREFICMSHPVKLAGIHNCTAYCCTVAIHVLCRRMSNNISSPLNWAAVNRCRECIIYNQRYPVCMCCSRKFFNVQNRKCRIGNRLAKYRSCVIFECRIQFLFCTVRRNKCNINSHLFHCHFN